jgi:hypothetical protein
MSAVPHVTPGRWLLASTGALLALPVLARLAISSGVPQPACHAVLGVLCIVLYGGTIWIASRWRKWWVAGVGVLQLFVVPIAMNAAINGVLGRPVQADRLWDVLWYVLSMGACPLLFFALLVYGFVTLFLRVHAKRSRQAGFCKTCDYDLTGNTSGRCPECGTPITPDDAESHR